MKELVKRLSVPIAEMGACMVMVCLLPSCSVASLFHEEIGKEEAMVLMADSTRYVGKTFLPDFQGKSFRLVTDEGKRVKIKSGEVEQLRFRRDGKQSGVFVYVPYVARGGKESKPGWVNCQGVGKESFSQFRLDYYSDFTDTKYGASPRTIMERNFQNCRRYATTFSANSGNLLFVGGTGLGKTFLSACIARAVADRGYSVVYETAGHLFSKMEQAKFSGSEEAKKEIVKYNTCDLLILDDLGTEMPGQFVTASLYGLLNDRILYNKPMVISTNLNVDEIARRYSPQIASRLHGNFVRLTFVGEDIRVLKNRGMQ